MYQHQRTSWTPQYLMNSQVCGETTSLHDRQTGPKIERKLESLESEAERKISNIKYRF